MDPEFETLGSWHGMEICSEPTRFGRYTPSECMDTLTPLIGLGPGLTPAGDDLITGFMVALHAASEISGDAALCLKLIQSQIELWSKKTTDISRWALLDAAKGFAAQPLLELCDILISDPSVADLEKATDRVLTLGSTSGVALVFGLLTGIAYALPSSCAEYH